MPTRHGSRLCLAYAGGALACLTLISALSDLAMARQVKPIPEVQNACKGARDNQALAECLWAATRVQAQRKRTYAGVRRLMEGIYKDIASPVLLPCKYQIRKSRAGGAHLHTALDQIAKREGVTFSYVPDTCADLAGLIAEIRGMPTHWQACPPAPYSYEHLEICMRSVLDREGGDQVIKRYFERLTPEPKSAKRLPLVGFASTLENELKKVESAHKSRLRKIEVDAKRCVSADVVPFGVGDLYAKAVTAGMRDYDMKPDGPYFKLQKAPTCQDVVLLAVSLKILSSDQTAAYEATRARRNKERAAAEKARCDVARANKAPTIKELTRALNGFVLDNCNKLFAVLRMLSRKQAPDPIGLGLTELKREGSWCTVKALTVKLSLKWGNITKQSCIKTGPGRYACNISGHMDCRSNARERMRRDFECALWTLPQSGIVMATYDAPACTWRAVPVENK